MERDPWGGGRHPGETLPQRPLGPPRPQPLPIWSWHTAQTTLSGLDTCLVPPGPTACPSRSSSILTRASLGLAEGTARLQLRALQRLSTALKMERGPTEPPAYPAHHTAAPLTSIGHFLSRAPVRCFLLSPSRSVPTSWSSHLPCFPLSSDPCPLEWAPAHSPLLASLLGILEPVAWLQFTQRPLVPRSAPACLP